MSQSEVQVQVVRSPNRKKTISATLNDGVLIVRIPKNLSQREERTWVERMKERLVNRVQKKIARTSDDLQFRAQALNIRFFQGRLPQFAARWVNNMNSRWGSCTPNTGEIRLSSDLAKMPQFVLDYVIVHELAHLIHADHSPKFWELVHRFPQTERAIGYLMGYANARNMPDFNEAM